MITKDQLCMTNNELEARVIELETQLKFAQNEAEVMSIKCTDLTDQLEDQRDDAEEARHSATNAISEAEGRYEALEAEIVEIVNSRPAIPYDEWYRKLHPGGAGSNPDLRYLAATKYDRIC